MAFQKNTTPIKSILDFLLTKYGIPEERFIEEMTMNYIMSEKTIENWLCGKVNPSKTGRKNLCEYFRLYTPRLNPSDFSLSSDSFIKKTSVTNSDQYINSFQVPLMGESLSVAQLHEDYKNLRGVYRSYRYAFENTGLIAKEYIVVKGFDEKTNLIKAKMISGSNTSMEVQGARSFSVETFNGHVICLGNTFYMMLASEEGQARSNQRVRFITLEKSEHHFLYDQFRYGILLSRSSYFGTPAAARILLKKISTHLDRNFNYNQLKKDIEFVTLDQMPKNIIEVISNDIKKHHMGVREDFILKTATSDMIEFMRPTSR